MKYVSYDQPGPPEVLHVAEMPAPAPRPGEVVIEVEAAGISRADTLQRQGHYPAPKSASPVLGLEASGTIAQIGAGVTGFSIGDRVVALCNGGGYAQYVAMPAGQVLPLPPEWSFVEGATLPENAFTVYDNLLVRARLRAGETVLIHGGTSGIGTTAIQLAAAWGATVYATAGSPEKARACERLGAVRGIDYQAEDFVAVVHEATAGRGVDVILDIVGAKYLARNLEAAAVEGRIVVISLMSGAKTEINLNTILSKRLTLTGSTLRIRSVAQKALVAEAVRRHVWPLIAAGRVKPVIHATFPLAQAGEAHRLMESSQHIGKIVLTV